MKKIALFIISFALIFASCNILWDVDTTDHVSMISCKPTVKLIGDEFMSLPVGSSYTEQGVEAYACDTPLTYTIVSGNVDPNTKGLYFVTYKAENSFGWTTYAYRTVLVYSGSPYITDIEGNFRVGFLFNATITKNDVAGFWNMDNCWAEEGVTFPITMAEDPNNPGHFIIVPGSHPTKAKSYSGYADFSNNKLTIVLNIIDYEGKSSTKTFQWIKS